MAIGLSPRLQVDREDSSKVLTELQKWTELSFTVAFAAGAGGSNTSILTIQAVDGFGAAVAGVFNLTAFLSAAATGAGLTGTAPSGSLVATVGAILATPVAQKAFSIQTNASGQFVGTLTDTGKTANQYFVAQRPRGDLVVAGPTITASYG